MLEQYVALAATSPDRPALIDGSDGRVTTRAQLLGRADAVAAELTTAGLASGDALAVQLPNSIDFAATWLAVLKLGLVMVPVDRDATETEVGEILAHFGIKGLVYRPDRNAPAMAISTRGVEARPSLPAAARLVKLTSGSTGMPKGIVTSEANLIADCRQIVSTMGITANDINLGTIPFSHSYGFSNLISPLILQGTAVVISNDYHPDSILELCNHYRCTVVPGIPMMFDHLTTMSRAAVFVSVKTFISAGAPLPPATSRKFRETFGRDIHSFYGCSECGGITYDRAGGAVERGTVGAAVEGVTLEIDRRRVTVRSGSVALGYLHDSSTFEKFKAGAFRTDDLVELREGNEVALIGRASDLINTAGKKVNPREVEQVILQLDGVQQAKVYGEAAGARGEVVAAVVVARPDVTRDQIRAFCRERLSLHKVPRIVKLIDSIPIDERGKVKRSALATL